jgi:hypothetical protein
MITPLSTAQEMMAAQLAEETEDECFALVTKTVMRKYD